jgi:hypothetical protein
MLYTLILLGFLLFALLLLFVIISAFLGFLITKVPFVPTDKADIKFIVDKLQISSKQVFYDLGSGNGKVCFLVNKLSGAQCVGFELTWWTHWWAVIKSKFIHHCQGFGGQENQKTKLQFKNQDFFKVSWSEADFIYAYLFPFLMPKIQEKFFSECKPGAVAIVRDFPFPHLKYSEKYFLPKNHEIYIYRK